jgi:hypothetical protein
MHVEPECRWQRFPAATPQVGHRTEHSSPGVSSNILMEILCDNIGPETVRFGTLSVPALPGEPVWPLLLVLDER